MKSGLLKPGEYKATLTDVESFVSATGKPCCKCTFKVSNRRVLFFAVPDNPHGLLSMLRMYQAFRVHWRNRGKELHKAAYKGKVVVDIINSNYGEHNVITRFIK